ncbi:MAG: Ldh family oxidoreductase, partial [Rhodospirillaceae bacterium]
MIVAAEPLRGLVAAVFERMGGPTEEAALVAGSLVDANLLGHDSHGVGLVATYAKHF